MTLSLKPPFTEEAARAKVQLAEDLWNTRDAERVVLAYTEDTIWRNRSEFLEGRAAILEFLKRKWTIELDYRLKKEMFAFSDDRIAVQFKYEYRTDSGGTFRAHGLEHWVFAEDGRMQTRTASINDVPIKADERTLPFIQGATS
ncbi:MAG: nuclear transport factor 2 family protein [Hyphomonadaceae bacterium]